MSDRLGDISLEPLDSELMRRARHGDPAAFHVLVERHADGLYALARSLVGEHTAAQDLVQETFLAAFEGVHKFRAESSVRTWLAGILANKSAAHHRRQSLRKTRPIDELNAPTAPDTAARADARMDVRQALDRLPPEQRQVIVLRELEGMSYEEIAEALRIPRGTVESRLHRARQALKDLLVGES